MKDAPMSTTTEWAVRFTEHDQSVRVIPLKSKGAAERAVARGLPHRGSGHEVVSREITGWEEQ